ncbi:helix-turn-helix transcriptional regulator [Streptomyces sp. B6B3]|uniref:helix-turn-helix domain-containing protein n=1 Tax=Streptomyces sp. B6B3 TaxID=3153570 RepID=UPI00325DDF85
MAEYENDGRENLRKVLAEEIRSQRERRSWSLRDVAAKTTYNHTYFSRIERGEQLPSDALAKTLDELFETGDLLQRILEAIRSASIQDYVRVMMKKEGTATRVQVFNSSLVTGLLQTERYMRALFRASKPGISDEELEAFTNARMARKFVFEKDDPPLFWSIMDEAALRRPVGGKECMVEQLEALVEMARSPNVVIQVHPFDAGAHPMMGGSMTLLTMPHGEHLAYVESFTFGQLIESPKRAAELTQLFDFARVHALCPEESLEFIGRCREEYAS